MKDIFLWIYENMLVLIVLLTPVVGFAWYKIKYKSLSDLTLPFFIIGVILTALGMFLNNITFSPEKTIQTLLLRDLEVAGKFIPIGYCFIIMAIMSFIDTVLGRIFKTNNRKKT